MKFINWTRYSLAKRENPPLPRASRGVERRAAFLRFLAFLSRRGPSGVSVGKSYREQE
jgi:hypothetical protein